MSTISVWILSVVGIIVISVVVDLILPNGSTSKFIKNIFAFVIVIVIISPLISFFSSKNFNLDDLFKENSIILQENFIASINRKKIIEIENNIEKLLIAKDIIGVKVGIMADVFETKFEINQISIDLSQVNENVNMAEIQEKIIEIILNFIKIEKNKIVFYNST